MSDEENADASRRALLRLGAAAPLALALSQPARGDEGGKAGGPSAAYASVRARVPDPQNIQFTVRFASKEPLRLAGHYWIDARAAAEGRRLPAIVELNPYRRRDGMLVADSMMYPWYAANGYLCVRVDLQGTGDSEGLIEDEYTEEELRYCVQVIEQVAAHPRCDGQVGMMGKSWSAINSLMLAARPDRPAALKAVIVCCGTDDRYNDDVHYMGGAMMFDNFSWPASMWSWLCAPPDPAVVGPAWQDMWRQRLRGADFWLKSWVGHPQRDAYWSASSVRERYADVGVPVFIFSGWQDGYHNPVERALAALTAAGRPVAAMIGPWGHKYPFDGYPGPRIDWLAYSLTHWWDRWLKGRAPDPDTQWPAMPVWLGASREPQRSLCGDDPGRWVAEDAGWRERSRELVLYLRAGHRLGAAAEAARYVSTAKLVDGTANTETSSWGECGNDDVPREQSAADRDSLCFDSEPLDADLDLFGEPVAVLTLSADRPVGSIAVRLCELSPGRGASHLITYRFFNLCHRGGSMDRPQPLEPGQAVSVRIPLGLVGHTLRKGWRIRLAVSSSFFPTMWAGTDPLTLTLHAGPLDGLEASRLLLPVRAARPEEDARAAALLPAAGDAPYVDPQAYVPVLAQGRPERYERSGGPSTIDGKPGLELHKLLDSGRYQYGGVLDGMWVDLVLREHYQAALDDPLSMRGTLTSSSTFERPHTGWRVRTETSASLHSERGRDGQAVFVYEATVRAYIGTPGGEDQLFDQRVRRGRIARTWV